MSRDLTVAEVVRRAYARAVPPNKLVKLLKARDNLSKDDLAGELAIHQTYDKADHLPFLLLAAALIPCLAVSSPPSLLLTYLSHLLSASLLSSRTALIHLLFYLNSHDVPPNSTLNILGTILVSSSFTSDENEIPSILFDPTVGKAAVPEIGTSASATPPPSPGISTLALLLPLLRICATQGAQQSLMTLVGRTVALLAPFPAPSLDVGLAAGQLLPSLPEEISVPLRTCLSGLMADLATQDLPQSRAAGGEGGHGGGGDGDVQMDGEAGTELPNADLKGREVRLPLPQTLSFLLENARNVARLPSSGDTTEGMDTPPIKLPQSYVDLIKIGSYLTPEPSTFLSALIEAVILSAIGATSAPGQDQAGSAIVELWGEAVELLPKVLRWWKDHSEDRWPFPSNFPALLGAVLQNLQPQMAQHSEGLSQTYSLLVAQAEADDEAAGFAPPEGWHMLSFQDTFVGTLVQLDILTAEEARTVGPNVHLPTPGESLVNRLSNATVSQLPPLAHIIDYAYGASASLADELIKVIKAIPVPPPENLFIHIASQPKIISALSAHIPPPSLLDLCISKLLNEVDEVARTDDPQGSLTRFGEGVILVEAIVSHFKLAMPGLLEESRRSISFSHLSDSQKSCMNSWVKAIFGSDGIEDEILLATSPQDLFRLAPSLIAQAIAATAVGQIDLDTLHSGLSYFSQPLLSWCLGGVIAWLCREIERQGLLSALHLIVLQDLVLSNACPDALLRVNASHLNAALDPNGGLGAVFESSSFDWQGVRVKLDSIGLSPEPITIPIPLGSAIQSLDHLPLAQAGWEKPLYSSISTSLRQQGPNGTIRTVMNEIFAPPSPSPSSASALVGGVSLAANDPLSSDNGPDKSLLIKFTPLLLVLPLAPRRLPTLSEALIYWLAEGLENPNVRVEAVLQILKDTLGLVHDLQKEEGNPDALAEELVEEINSLVCRPVPAAEAKGRRKTAGDARRDKAIRLREGLKDDLLRSKFAVLDRLAG